MIKALIILLISATPLLTQEMLLFDRDYLPYTDTTLIFTPSDYKPDQKYPLLIMLHGWTGNYNQWNEIIPLQHASDDYGFIIATPDGFNDCWYIDSPLKPNSKFETFFINDLLPTLIRNYSIDTSAIFITGLSMGGHGAITLFLKYPNLIKSAGSTSGILDLTKFSGKWGLAGHLGPVEKTYELWAQNSAINLLPNIRGLNLTMIVDCGTEDFAINVNKEFAAMAELHEINIKFMTSQGNHSKEYWKNSIKEHLLFFKTLNR